MFSLSKCATWTVGLCVGGTLVACGVATDASDTDVEEGVSVTGAALCNQKPRNIQLPSNTTWNSYSSAADGSALLGKAELVCLNATSPVGCPAGATEYGYPGTGWATQINACNGDARWIWAPDITPASAPAELAEYSFEKRVRLAAHPVTAVVHIAADDFAEVIVNGTKVGTVGSTTDINLSSANQAVPTTIDIASALVTGTNTIAIRAVNGAGSFGSCTDCTYQQQPAGVTFCVDIKF